MRRLYILMGILLALCASTGAHAAKAALKDLQLTGYDSHVELRWQAEPGLKVQVYAAVAGSGKFALRAETSEQYCLDFVTDLGRNLALDYKLVVLKGDKKVQETAPQQVRVRDFSDEELLDMVQRYTFRYFWDAADPLTGLAYERTTQGITPSKEVTIGGGGFGLMAVLAGAERGWITREQALDHMLKVTAFLQGTDRFKGMWSHWYWAETGRVKAFSSHDNGGDIVETSFMAQALLTARQYFDGKDSKEKALRERITTLWEDMDWKFYTNGTDNMLFWHWSEQHGFGMNHRIRGYNEALITYVLAASSPTAPIDPKAYHDGWAGWDNPDFANYKEYYGMALPLGNARWMGGPLFFAHYSYLGLDPRGLSDDYANYWEQNRRQTLINRAYCMDNPYAHAGYGEGFWGLTASDRVPEGYTAHAPGYRRDEGTIAPTAALSSTPYTPAESIKVIKNLYRNHGKHAFGLYGFYDAVNMNQIGSPEGYVRQNYIAIDQGPIVVMIENHRSGLLWKYFMKDPDVRNGLQRLGFRQHGRPLTSVAQ